MKKESLLEIELVVRNVRNKLNKENSLNNIFVDYCDLASEMVKKDLIVLGYNVDLIQGLYTHQYKDSEEEEYSHFWLET